ncbi:MAG TPA: type II secretion system F family protein [Candidatus Limnocylindria bacterium]
MIASAELIAILGAAAVVAFALGLWLPAFERDRLMRRRLADVSAISDLAIDRGGQRRSLGVQLPAVRSSGAFGWLRDAIAQADAKVTPGDVLIAAALTTLSLGGVAWFISSDLFIGLMGAIVGAMAPFVWLRWQRGRRRATFVQQLPNTVSLLASMVRGGNTFLQALEHVGQESEEPTRSAMSLVVREIGLGASQEDALDRLSQRFPSDDVTLLVASVNVHHQIGGALSGILERIAETLRERVRLQGEIRTLTAAQRLSAYVLAALPVLVAIGRALTDRESFDLFFTVDYLRIALIVAALMVVAGSYAMRRMAAIDV